MKERLLERQCLLEAKGISRHLGSSKRTPFASAHAAWCAEFFPFVLIHRIMEIWRSGDQNSPYGQHLIEQDPSYLNPHPSLRSSDMLILILSAFVPLFGWIIFFNSHALRVRPFGTTCLHQPTNPSTLVPTAELGPHPSHPSFFQSNSLIIALFAKILVVCNPAMFLLHVRHDTNQQIFKSIKSDKQIVKCGFQDTRQHFCCQAPDRFGNHSWFWTTINKKKHKREDWTTSTQRSDIELKWMNDT